ncbi:hypothetical protein [Kiloniella litopenaei]|uniref:hypothetical protein n=1 Tax=Kiloniella litopenaei TaxID=1549748 RepID=UPI003BA98038
MSRPGDKGDRSIALFLLALLLFSPLFLSIFSGEKLIWGLPPLFLYLFAAWGGIILAVAWSASKDADDATRSLESNESSVIDTLVSDHHSDLNPSLSDQEGKEQTATVKGNDHAG